MPDYPDGLEEALSATAAASRRGLYRKGAESTIRIE
jgi:hypothetical protein